MIVVFRPVKNPVFIKRERGRWNFSKMAVMGWADVKFLLEMWGKPGMEGGVDFIMSGMENFQSLFT